MSFSFNGSGFGQGGGFSMQPQADDPLENVEYTGDLPADCGAEFEALQESFEERKNREGMAARAKAERERFQKATDSEFWFAVCFEDRDEKERALKALKVNKRMMGDKYLDGRKLMQVLGLEY